MGVKHIVARLQLELDFTPLTQDCTWPWLVFYAPPFLTQAVRRKLLRLRCQIAFKNKTWILAASGYRVGRSLGFTPGPPEVSWARKSKHPLRWFTKRIVWMDSIGRQSHPMFFQYPLRSSLELQNGRRCHDCVYHPRMGGWRFHFSRASALFTSLLLVSHVRSLYVIGWYKSYEPKARWME